ncbi:hypothetical protein Cgig2_019038 [Carnegiea gigantea]|uniref:Uncharacterized protein n=1 Tax=Carnegiea gigantea TaxID=171969 RepID=A0A9Q1GXY7_9CARY|nr:hypothetical protein Cgig2_019038 [Carnegiea gigantea]
MVSIRTANTLGKILKDQKASRGEKEIVRKKLQLRQPIQRLPITRLALPLLGALHGLNCLSHKLGDGPGLSPSLTGRLSLLSCRLPKRVSHRFTLVPVRNRTKRKLYFQCFTFDFFSMAVIKPGLLLKHYHPKSPDLYNHRMKRKSETVVKSRTINDNTFYGRLIHYGIRLRDHEGISSGQKGQPSSQESDCEVHPADLSGACAIISVINPSGAQSFLLSTDLPGADDPSGEEELVDAPSEDELLDERSEEKLKKVPPEEATLALGWDEDGTEQGLPCVPSASSLSGDLIRGVDWVFAIP